MGYCTFLEAIKSHIRAIKPRAVLAADRLARDINVEVEALILGTKKVSEL